MPSDPNRPDPDTLLARVRRDDARARRGRLRIYFGASAGVGKTFAMLVAGKRAAHEGRDVLVGLVETHGRAETEAVLAADTEGPALPILSRTRDAFDLDAALVRRPDLILVDELAHSNAPGSRHAKRWQDVDELLAAGIDVFTTLNVQHLESLNDVVGGITGVVVRETVPDTFFDRADDVVLVDIPADELLKRLAAGKVYVPAQAERAARHFFRKGNLIALREIALRRTADRVEGDVQAYRDERAIGPVWGTEAALLGCVGPDAGAERVVRAAGRLAGQLGVDWHAVYVETPRLQRLPDAERNRVLRVLSLAQQLGATTAVLSGSEPGDAIAQYARRHNLSRLVIGRTSRRAGWWRALVAPSLAERLAKVVPEVDLVVVGLREGGAAAPSRTEASVDRSDTNREALGAARFIAPTLIVAAVTLAMLPLAAWLDPTNIAMLYLLVVALVAMRAGRAPAAFAAVLAVAAFDFFFVPPRFSFAVSDVQYGVTLAVMLAIALSIGTLTSNLRYQARVAEHREARSRSLYEIARDLSTALRAEDVMHVVERAVGEVFRADVRVLLTEDAAGARRLTIDSSLAQRSGFEPAIAQWAFERGEAAGIGTDTLAGSDWLFVPLTTTMGTRGVLALRPRRRRLLGIPEQRRLLDTVAALTAIAIERTHYVEVAQHSIVKVESERLRNSILSALSHDLRTPIAALSGLTETLAMAASPSSEHALVEAARDEVRRMGALVENLLEMARIESGDVVPRRAWHAIEEAIGAALAATERLLARHRVTTIVLPHLPLAEYDPVLIERVIYNLIENAAKYSPPGATVLIEATAPPDALVFAVEDDGPGLPAAYDAAHADALFDKFTRGVDESTAAGVGLGLAICRAIVEAHGGTIAIDSGRHLPSRPDRRGFRVVVRLPRRDAPPADEAPLVDEPDEGMHA